jgi:hypothetical protein
MSSRPRPCNGGGGRPATRRRRPTLNSMKNTRHLENPGRTPGENDFVLPIKQFIDFK